MNVTDVANGIIAMCKKGKFMEAIDTYYADNIVSVDSVGNESMPKKMEGIEAICGKAAWWIENNEVHRCDIVGPYLGQDGKFALYFSMDVTSKPQNQRVEMEEMAWPTVKNGKIVYEQFFYNPNG